MWVIKMKVTKDIIYVGVNDHKIDLFEGQYAVPNGMSYNSYVILDDKVAVMDTVDKLFVSEWLDNIDKVLIGKKPDYLIIQHMEPDHSAGIVEFIKKYPNTKIVGNIKTFKMIEQFFHYDITNKIEVVDGEMISLGNHNLKFIFAPMVHWPEVMVTYDTFAKVLFSADAFGKFGALDIEDEWTCEARRYYFGIVGMYGPQVQILLKKAATLEISTICPLHGPILNENLDYYLKLYNIWSSYKAEDDGVLVAYTSVYGNTKKAALLLKEELNKLGYPNVILRDLARTDMSEVVEDAFRYPNIVLATTTYNGGIFPFMNTFLDVLIEHKIQNKNIGIIDNGSWMPMAHKIILKKLELTKNNKVIENPIKILSSMNEENIDAIKNLAKKLIKIE